MSPKKRYAQVSNRKLCKYDDIDGDNDNDNDDDEDDVDDDDIFLYSNVFSSRYTYELHNIKLRN